MVCEFVGSIGSTGEKDHLFTTDDPVMVKELGLNAFTLEDLFNALETRIPLWQLVTNIFNDPINNARDAMQAILYPMAERRTGGLYFEEFVESVGIYSLRHIGHHILTALPNYTRPTGAGPGSPNSYAGLTDGNEVRQIILLNKSLWVDNFAAEGWANPYTETYAKALIDAIQASPDGCLTFQSKFKYNFSVNGEANCEKEITPTFRLYLYDRHYEKPDERRLGVDGSLLMAMKAKNVAGQQQGAPKYGTGIGEVTKQTGGLADITAGELDTYYEANTGMYEAGTPNMLARLLTDLDAVTVNPIDVKTIDVRDMQDYCDPKNPSFLGHWAGGWALPLTVQKGNPNLFTPTYVDKTCEGEKKYKIKVINRSARSFTAGDLVMCFRIHGLWYVMGFGDEDDGPGQGVFKTGKWSFMNMIAERRSFFRGNRYFEAHKGGDDNAGGVVLDVPAGTPMNMTSPASYESYFRENWFFDMYQTDSGGPNDEVELLQASFAGLNDYKQIAMRNTDFLIGLDVGTITSTELGVRNFNSCKGGYYQQSSFDMLHKTLGGVNENGNMIARTHMFRSPDGTESSDEVQKNLFIPFWGATFPDGYQPDKIKKLKSPDFSQHKLAKYGWHEHLIGDDWGNIADQGNVGGVVKDIFKPTENKNDAGGNQAVGLWTDQSDQNGLQVPADVALLASPDGENGYGMEAFYDLQNRCSFKGGGTNDDWYVDGFSKTTMEYMLPDINDYPSRFNWLVRDDESEPSNPGMLPSLYDFKPMNPNVVEFKPLWADYLGSLDKSNQVFTTLPYTEAEHYYLHSRKNTDDFLNPDRTAGSGPEDAIVSESFLKRARLGGVNTTQIVGGDGSTPASWQGVPYGRMVGGAQLAHIRFGSDENSGNIVGLTLAKAKIHVKAVELTFLTSQRFGLSNVVQAAGGGSAVSIIFGGFIGGIGFSGPGAHNNRSGQWGRNTETPWLGGSFGTTALHVRMCDQWPDAQTLLDPRYFAVMHFNPQSGVYADGSTPEAHTTVAREIDEIYLPGNNDLKDAKIYGPTGTELLDESWSIGDPLPEFKHKVDKSYTPVDLRVPTYTDKDGNDTHMLAGDSIINGDWWRGNGDVFLEPEHWRINPVRRGQLLPFTYPHRVIGLHFSATPIPGLPIPPKRGSGFAEGDLITAGGGHGVGVELEVTDVEDLGISTEWPDGQPGAIKDWKVTKDDLKNHNIGEGYLPQDFPTSAGTPLLGINEGTIQLIPKTGSGTGLDYTDTQGKTMIIEGIVYDRWNTDEGPTRYPTIHHLSLPSHPIQGYGQTPGLVVGQQKKSIQLDPEHDGAYDLFFLFHADVQHYVAHNITFSNNAAQFCNVEISASN